MAKRLFAGIEGGGTKFICAVADENNAILAEARIPTTNPPETLQACGDFFAARQQALGPLSALGIACFGPVDPNPTSPTYGKILATPKPGWANTDVLGPFQARFGLPTAFDTDVNGAVLAESLWGAGKGLQNLVYFTIGTGIGAGAIVSGQLVHGFLHPEMGHYPLPHDLHADPFPGVCPFHGDCFEGLASGPSMRQRWGVNPEDLPPDHPAWQLEAHYIALALVNMVYTLAPERIILSGGVLHQSQLFPLVRAELLRLLNGYIQVSLITAGMETYIVPSPFDGKAGLYGALALAQQAGAESPLNNPSLAETNGN